MSPTSVVKAELDRPLSPLVQEKIARALGISRVEVFPEPDLEEAAS